MYGNMTAHIPYYGLDVGLSNWYHRMPHGESKWADRLTSFNGILTSFPKTVKWICKGCEISQSGVSDEQLEAWD